MALVTLPARCVPARPATAQRPSAAVPPPCPVTALRSL